MPPSDPLKMQASADLLAAMIYNHVIGKSAQVRFIMNYLLDTTQFDTLEHVDPSTWFNVPVHNVEKQGTTYIGEPYDPKVGELHARMLKMDVDDIEFDKDILIEDVVYVTSKVYYIIYSVQSEYTLDTQMTQSRVVR